MVLVYPIETKRSGCGTNVTLIKLSLQFATQLGLALTSRLKLLYNTNDGTKSYDDYLHMLTQIYCVVCVMKVFTSMIKPIHRTL